MRNVLNTPVCCWVKLAKSFIWECHYSQAAKNICYGPLCYIYHSRQMKSLQCSSYILQDYSKSTGRNALFLQTCMKALSTKSLPTFCLQKRSRQQGRWMGFLKLFARQKFPCSIICMHLPMGREIKSGTSLALFLLRTRRVSEMLYPLWWRTRE